jgi:uncharacterized membrane protein YhfC
MLFVYVSCKEIIKSLNYTNERRFIKVKFKKQDNGVAGLTILLSLVTMLFVIGLIVMIFALMGGELQNATTDETAIGVINDTTTSISSVTDWFPIFIVIGAMVVLILLTVIIISAIRGSGMIQTGSA